MPSLLHRIILYTILLTIATSSFEFLCLAMIFCLWMGSFPFFNSTSFESIDLFIAALFAVSLLQFSCVVQAILCLKQGYERLICSFVFTALTTAGFFLFLAIYAVVNPSAIDLLLTSLWDSMRMQGRARFQDFMKCCGLRNPSDRVADSGYCPVSITPAFSAKTKSIGCLPKLKRILGSNSEIWIILMSVLAMISLFSIYVVYSYQKEKKRKASEAKTEAVRTITELHDYNLGSDMEYAFHQGRYGSIKNSVGRYQMR